MTSSNDYDLVVEARQLAKAAIDVVANKAKGGAIPSDCSITINFHPIVSINDESVVTCLLRDGVYRSQYETGTSSGSFSSHAGGRRWLWEQSMFDGVYDNAPAALRPKYGALNHLNSRSGGAPRFGSAHLRLKPHVTLRSTFAYPDSHLEPTEFGTATRMALMPLVVANKQRLEPLDNYVEAHVHGLVHVLDDVEAIVLDPSYKQTQIEADASKLPCKLEWHAGFVLSNDHYDGCIQYRGQVVADFTKQIIKQGRLTPAFLDTFRDGSVNEQLVKKTWHCLARFGAPAATVS